MNVNFPSLIHSYVWSELTGTTARCAGPSSSEDFSQARMNGTWPSTTRWKISINSVLIKNKRSGSIMQSSILEPFPSLVI